MIKVIQADATNNRGERNVIDGEAALLTGFEFNQNGRLDKTFFAPYSHTIDRTAGTLSVSIPEFVSNNFIVAPAGSSHFKLVLGGAAVDFENGSYQNGLADGGEQVLTASALPAQTLSVAITPASTSPIFLVFGIEFYQAVNSKLYPLRNGAFNALAIVEVG